MDGMTMVIGVCLIWTGAMFFGYPIGNKVGRWQERRLREAQETFFGEPAVIVVARRRLAGSDILSADTLEEVKDGLTDDR